MINFVSNLPMTLRSGGFSAMNVAAYNAAQKCDAVHYVGPINPPAARLPKITSKLRRLTGLKGNYAFFSERRLRKIAAEVNSGRSKSANLDFFHGFTPWIMTKRERPYIAWSDCTFRDYIQIFHDPTHFKPTDIARIEATEANWLALAERVIFTSQWAAKRAQDGYGLPKSKIGVVGIFGEIDPPTADTYKGEKSFLFVSTNFAAKGGNVVLSAFCKIRKNHPTATLTVIGDAPQMPPPDGVRFIGFLSKEVPEQASRFRSIFEKARAMVHPTRSDILPLLLIEAGYFGVPAITTNQFAIPEFVNDGQNGILINDPKDSDAVASAMERVLESDEYPQMRIKAWDQAHREYSKASFETKLITEISNVLHSCQ